jgi:hypothetical protein
MRKQELSDDIIQILHTRIALSQSGQFSMREVWEGWQMSKSTLLRYKENKYRELSREIARKHNSIRKGFNGLCAKCDEPLKGHLKCIECEILLHSNSLRCRCGHKHGDTVDGVICTDCIDTLRGAKLSPYEELYGETDY